MFLHRFGLAAILAVLPALAPAATVTITMTTYANDGSALTARDSFIGGRPVLSEDFEEFVACTSKTDAGSCANGTINTNVGQFTGIAPSITNGGSQVAPKDRVVVRTNTPDPFGRFNVTPDGKNWLDSNDMYGIKWEVPGMAALPMITRIAFLLTDVDDVGDIAFQLLARNLGDYEFQAESLKLDGTDLPNGTLHLVTMLFSDPVKDLRIKMLNGKGDGFGVDGVRMAVVPLPAAGLLLLGALGGLAAMRRRKKAA